MSLNYTGYRLRPDQETLDRFWAKVDLLDGFATDEDCWLWTGAKEKAGYGSFRYRQGYSDRASRIVFRIYKGEIPIGLFVCHSCDSRLCVNPSHLFLSNARGNMNDMYKTGRKRLGENHVQAKLSNADVLAVKEFRTQGYSQTEIAKMFGVGQPHISKIVRGQKRRRDNDLQVFNQVL